ncbi:MAG: hypothetical protein ABJ056_15235 [Halioglobus sp.]
MIDQQTQARQLAFHAVVILGLGMVAGYFWGNALGDPTVAVSQANAWRLAHIEGFANGVLMLVVALSYSLVQPNEKAEKLIRFGMIVVGYSNILASGYGGIFDARGTMPSADSSVHDVIVFFGFMPGVVAIFIVLGAMASSLRKPA